jgi:hypothetical protein
MRNPDEYEAATLAPTTPTRTATPNRAANNRGTLSSSRELAVRAVSASASTGAAGSLLWLAGGLG